MNIQSSMIHSSPKTGHIQISITWEWISGMCTCIQWNATQQGKATRYGYMVKMDESQRERSQTQKTIVRFIYINFFKKAKLLRPKADQCFPGLGWEGAVTINGHEGNS